ncbi:TM2 domain-containing protein [Rhodococcus rhodnii]|uniref:TM2 domain-containing protein n=2 Tax=Rhodococcus rhodnii TaxID=38312 RepID=R7WTI3_9NOCA|nr:hypothetical protein [Rhodococcus rhodnii]EOM78563.1 hypothetical protein Rrhod_0101 [Rhodococcus rhodnii LMG 5362]TXG91348.1 TM2 domain-containing protein [Rhodococcus rhodnii]
MTDERDTDKSAKPDQQPEGGEYSQDTGAYDYGATAEASLSDSTSSGTPAPGSASAGPGWDTFAGVGNGPGWGTTPTYPVPNDTAGPDETTRPDYTGPIQQYGLDDGPTFGAPDPAFGAQAPGYGSGAPQQSAPQQRPPQQGPVQQPPPPQPGMYPGPFYADPAAPYGRDPRTGQPLSNKSRTTAGLLQLLPSFVGVCGVGRLYTGSIAIGLAQFVLMFAGYALMLLLIGFLVVPAIWIWNLVDAIRMFSGDVDDGEGRKLTD